jgi:hypothetical protein
MQLPKLRETVMAVQSLDLYFMWGERPVPISFKNNQDHCGIPKSCTMERVLSSSD